MLSEDALPCWLVSICEIPDIYCARIELEAREAWREEEQQKDEENGNEDVLMRQMRRRCPVVPKPFTAQRQHLSTLLMKNQVYLSIVH